MSQLNRQPYPYHDFYGCREYSYDQCTWPYPFDTVFMPEPEQEYPEYCQLSCRQAGDRCKWFRYDFSKQLCNLYNMTFTPTQWCVHSLGPPTPTPAQCVLHDTPNCKGFVTADCTLQGDKIPHSGQIYDCQGDCFGIEACKYYILSPRRYPPCEFVNSCNRTCNSFIGQQTPDVYFCQQIMHDMPVPSLVRQLDRSSFANSSNSMETKMLKPNEKMVEPNAKMVEPNAKVVEPNAKMLEPSAKIVEPNAKMADALQLLKSVSKDILEKSDYQLGNNTVTATLQRSSPLDASEPLKGDFILNLDVQ